MTFSDATNGAGNGKSTNPRAARTRLAQTLDVCLAPAACVALALPAMAQEATTGYEGHSMMGDMKGDMGSASRAFLAANDAMHQGMAIEFTGNADVDFVLGMMPHHQGAVDMARIVQEHGSHPEVRKFAEGVITAPEAEIKWMQNWLAANGG